MSYQISITLIKRLHQLQSRWLRKITYASIMADEGIHPLYEKALDEVREILGREWPMYINGKEESVGRTFKKRSPIDTRPI